MTIDLLSILFLIAFVGAMLLFILLPRYGPHYTSRLTCPNCKKILQFSLDSRSHFNLTDLREQATLKCPYCHVKSTYDIMSTRVSKPKKTSKVKQKA